MSELEWSEEMSRVYAKYMETNIKHDHRKWANKILADWRERPAEATVVDVAGGPGFLLFEVACHLDRPRLILTDGSAIMVKLAGENARKHSLEIETHLCMAEKLDIPDAIADIVLCKHFVRLSSDLDAALREMTRVLRSGGRIYIIDFNAEGSWLGKRLLNFWIQLTAPPFLRATFWDSMCAGLKASSLLDRVKSAGLADGQILSSGVSYLVRAIR